MSLKIWLKPTLTTVDLWEVSFILWLVVKDYSALLPLVVDALDLGKVDHPILPLDKNKIASRESELFIPSLLLAALATAGL